MQQMAEAGEIPGTIKIRGVWTLTKRGCVTGSHNWRQNNATAEESRRRKAPPNTEWHGDTLYGRIRIKGTLKRWSLRTSDVELARQMVATDIERLKVEVSYPDHTRVRYEDMLASWAERHIAHEVSGLTVTRYGVSLRQLEPFLRGKFKDEIDKGLISTFVDARRAAGVSTATIERDLGALPASSTTTRSSQIRPATG